MPGRTGRGRLAGIQPAGKGMNVILKNDEDHEGLPILIGGSKGRSR